MIISSLIGGLGNQLFEYAAGRALAHKHGSQLKLDTYSLDQSFRTYCLENFNICAEKANIRDILRFDKTEGLLRIIKPLTPNGYFVLNKLAQKLGKVRFIIRYYSYKPGSPLPPLLVKRVASQRLFDFDEDYFNLPDNVVLLGTWISYKYLEHIRPLLLNEFSVRNDLNGNNRETAEKIKNTVSVSIHVRRTDKVNHPDYFVTDINYLNKAMAFFHEKCEAPIFYVFSDDIEWCKVNLRRNNTVFVDWNDEAHAFEDLRLMSLCKHNIIAESSFSWWGAYLNKNPKKIVITPSASRWVKRKNSLCKDILPPEWRVFD